MFLWYKFFHIFFMVSWFAGLFYLPRIFVNLAMVDDATEQTRLLLMARKLYRFMIPWAFGTMIFGLLMPLTQIGFAPWVWGKITVATILVAYHFYCGKLLHDFEANRNTKSHKWYRVFNELPVFCLLAAIYFALFKP